MGKSPGKWIKTVLFRKKSSRSSASKKYANGKDTEAKNGGDSLVISHPLPVTTGQGANSESQNETSSALHFNGTTRQSVTEEEKSGRAVTCESECIYTKKEEAAAVTLQAAFRGYLARRAFHALWGIIRLQSLYRGHLVRRQAVVTLRCIGGIVKLQAIVRGRKVRQSDIGLEIHSKFSKVNIKDAKHVDYASTNLRDQSENISSNGLVSKLLASPVAKPIHIKYANDEPNSVLSWLERWSSIQLWKPASLPKKPNDIKPKIRSGGYALETESGKMKRGRKTYSSDNGSMITTESEKSKRIPRKASFPTAEPVQEQPHSELEKVKRSLRKITSSYAQASDIAEGESDKLKRTMRSVPSSQVDSSDPVLSSSEKATKDNIQLPEIPIHNLTVQVLDLEIESSVEANPNPSPFSKTEEFSVMKSIDEYVVNDAAMDTSILSESHTLIENGNHSPLNEQLIPLQEESAETQKMSKRRASLSAKSENVENGLPTTPTLPSYMAATESAKAKLRGQTSPRLSSDGIDKNGFVRRHSLPNSTNGKLVQRPGNNIMKMGRDQPIRVEWKR